MPIPYWTVIPFVLLLIAIACSPLLAPHIWESNRSKALVTFSCALPILCWLLVDDPAALRHTALDYASFICLLGSLFVISGDIAVTGDLRATPAVNTAFLAVGALLANLIGTTGASMVLIRSFLRTNSERQHTRHLPVFFIFIVSNCGGMLTPLGDPPLFLGYLRGVPFFWTITLFPIWAVATGALLVAFYCWDRIAYAREGPQALALDRARIRPLRFEGGINLLFLAGVLAAVFLPSPGRELLMIAMAAASLRLGPNVARRLNRFTWGPIVEVAILFAGIFITMVPALELLRANAPAFGLSKPWHFFWTTGILSSLLDNAPTYLTFLAVAQGLNLPADLVGVPEALLRAISVGAVLMGANTYIGNGPNFMVKAIADHAGFHTPSFLGYMRYAVMVLFPIYFLVHWIFLS
ncbi:MAG: sodium:proton antiporter [Deltaproteobacteria bacterium]|nr:sodium:proton antiporter [Deltaproteobacteria bacterium]